MKPEHYHKLAEAKLTVEQIGVVMQIMAEAEEAMKVAEEARKSVARERVQRWRDKQKEAVTLPKQNGNATVRLTRVEDSSSKKDISGKDKKEASPSARGTRVPDDFVPDVEWAITQGLSSSQAKFESAQFIDFWRSKPGKDGLKLDWPGTWRMWVRNAIKRSTGPPKKRSYADVAEDKFTRQANGSESIFGSHGDAQRIPPRLIESRPDDAHLRGGIGGRFRPSDH